MSKLPPAIEAAVRAQRRTGPAAIERKPKVGDVLFVAAVPGSAATRRLAVVLQVHDYAEGGRGPVDADGLEVALAHPYVELASSTDVILSAERYQLPYDLVVEAAIQGVVWSAQGRHVVGSLEGPVVDRIRAVGSGDEVGDGLPVGGIVDRRWSHKDGEVDAIQALSASLMATLIDGEAYSSFDPNLLNPQSWARGDATVEARVVLEVLDRIADGSAVCSFAEVAQLRLAGAFSVEPWIEAFGDLGQLLYERLLQVFQISVPDYSAVLCELLEPGRQTGALAPALHQVPYMLTHSSFFGEEVEDGSLAAISGSNGREELRLRMVDA